MKKRYIVFYVCPDGSMRVFKTANGTDDLNAAVQEYRNSIYAYPMVVAEASVEKDLYFQIPHFKIPHNKKD